MFFIGNPKGISEGIANMKVYDYDFVANKIRPVGVI